MAMAVPAPQSGGFAQNLPLQVLQRPQRAHINDHDIEQALPRRSNEMEPHGVKWRGRRERTADDSAGSSSESGPTLTPSSSRDEDNTQDVPRLTMLALATWRKLAQFVQNPLSRPTAEEVQKSNTEREYDKLIPKKVDGFPEGLPQLAAFTNSDDSFANFRRFGRLSHRILHHCQIALTELEKELDDLDADDATNPTMKFRLYGHEGYRGCDNRKRKLIEKASVKYKEYADILSKYAQLRALSKTTERNHKKLLDWIVDEKPLGNGKYDFIFHDADEFVSPGMPPEKDRGFEDNIESLLDYRPLSSLRRFLQTEKEKSKTDDKYVHYYSPLILTVVGNTIVVLLTVGGIAIPVLLLFLQRMVPEIMATVAICFVLLFAVSVSLMTKVRVQDLMFGTATYSAVILMFLNSISQGSKRE